MSTYTSNTHKSMGNDEDSGKAQKEYMHYAGRHQMRPEQSKDVSDNINGTVNLSESDIHAINAKENSKIRVLAEAGDESVVIERTIHSNGRSFTIPLSARKQLGLTPGSEVELWVDLVEREPEEETKEVSTPETKSKAEMEQLSVWFVGDEFYHYVENEDAEETKCGISLDSREYRGPTEDPGEFLTVCSDCAVRSSRAMSNDEIVDWLAEHAGFERTGGPPSYLNKDQLVALRDYILELQDQAPGDEDEEADWFGSENQDG